MGPHRFTVLNLSSAETEEAVLGLSPEEVVREVLHARKRATAAACSMRIHQFEDSLRLYDRATRYEFALAASDVRRLWQACLCAAAASAFAAPGVITAGMVGT
ncbi:hypothetical protein AB4212_32850, partial [Streptomyces sp. 2MCAF27]